MENTEDKELDNEVQTQIESNEERTNAYKSTKFPQTRVRNMMKMDPDLHLASQESVFVVCKSVVSIPSIVLMFYRIYFNFLYVLLFAPGTVC